MAATGVWSAQSESFDAEASCPSMGAGPCHELPVIIPFVRGEQRGATWTMPTTWEDFPPFDVVAR